MNPIGNHVNFIFYKKKPGGWKQLTKNYTKEDKIWLTYNWEIDNENLSSVDSDIPELVDEPLDLKD